METINWGVQIGAYIVPTIIAVAVMRVEMKNMKVVIHENTTRIEKANSSRRSGEDRLRDEFEKKEEVIHGRIEKTQDALKESENKLEKRIEQGFDKLHADINALKEILINRK